MPQIQKGTTYTSSGSGSQVTHTNLNAHVDNASLLTGAIDDQTYNSASSNSDSILITKSGVLYKQTKADFTGTLSTKSIDAGALNDVTVTPYDGTTVTGSTYSSSNGLLNTVTTSVAHNLTIGQIVLISSASNYFYNGYYTIKTVPTSTSFAYELNMFDMYSGTGSFSSSNGTLVTVTTGTAHNFSNNQPLKITASDTPYSGIFNITVTGANTFTYTLTTSTTAGTGTISYITTSAIAGNGTLSYQKMAVVKVNGSQSVTGVLSVAGSSDLIGDVYVKGNQINDGTVTQNGTVNITGAIQYNGTPVYGLRELTTYPVDYVNWINTSTPTWTSPLIDKPSGEIWEIEIAGWWNWYTTAGGGITNCYFYLYNDAKTVLYRYIYFGNIAETGGILKFIIPAGTALANERFKLYQSNGVLSGGGVNLGTFMYIKKYTTA
jgi:hypothetical protein